MNTVLVVLHVLVCIFLIAVVLLQRGKGAEIGAVFGSGASSTVFGSRGAGNFLTKLEHDLLVRAPLQRAHRRGAEARGGGEACAGGEAALPGSRAGSREAGSREAGVGLEDSGPYFKCTPLKTSETVSYYKQ